MGVGERGVDLNGARVALQGTLDVVHLLEGVAHVGVGVCEGGLDSEERRTTLRVVASSRNDEV